MEKLFVEKFIDLKSPVSKVWEILTKPEYIKQWAPEFSGGSQFYIESDWHLGSSVLWKDQDGKVVVEGNVTAVIPNKFLRFTVFDVRSDKPPVTEEDGITYKLSSVNGVTNLHILQGDFLVMTDGEKYRNLSAEIWDKVLLTVKRLAENKE